MKRTSVAVTAGLLLLTLLLPQVVLSDVPGLSGLQVADRTATSATITWFTNSTSIGTVYYDTSKPPTTFNATESSAVNFHSITLTGLDPATVYYFYVRSGSLIDNNGGAYYSFETLPIPPGYYKITLEPACGVCGEVIESAVCGKIIGATAIVSSSGTYRICWDSRASSSVVATFGATGAGSYHLTFHMPEAKKGTHNVYLTNDSYEDLGTDAVAEFVVDRSVNIDVGEGTVGTEVTLNGFGFDPTQQIQIKFNDTVASSTSPTIDSKGSWEFSYTIPPTPAGGYAFGIGPSSDSTVVWLSKPFRVIPAITIIDANPNDGIYSGTVGQTIEVNGSGFKTKEEGIQITFDGEPVNINSPVVADDNGSWQADIAIPPLQRGTYSVGASGDLTRARDVQTVDFIVGAGILLEPTSAYIGDTITVIGGGFAPDETGIKVNFGTSTVSTGITAGSDGTWESSFTLPASTYGGHSVSASGDITAPAVTNTVNVQAKITGLSPNDGAPGDSVSFTGNGFHGNQELTVTIGGVAASEHPQSQSNGNVNGSFHVPNVGTTGTLTLVATDASGASASYDFTVETKTLATPIPVSPKDSTLRSGQVTFEWLTGGSDVTYILQISQTTSFASATQPETTISGLSYTLTSDNALRPGIYYWRVGAVDNYGNESPYSDPVEFTVAPIPTWVWVVIGVVVLVVLLSVAYRETKFRVTE